MTQLVRLVSSAMALSATSVALGISYIAGTERGGLPMERAIWIGVGLVLALSAHLIPALIGRQGVGRKAVGYALWLACMFTTIGGHAQFFLQAQQHAGQVRASAIARPVAHGRDLIAILDDRAKTEQRLSAKQAFLASRHCKAGCALTQSDIAGLQGHLAVLEAERAQAAKEASNQDRYEAKAEQAAMDPVAVALAQFGIAPEKVQTLMSMAAALTLELVACLFWSMSLSPVKASQKAQQAAHAHQAAHATAPRAVQSAAAAPAPAPVVAQDAAPAPVAVQEAVPAIAAAFATPFRPRAVQIPMDSALADTPDLTDNAPPVARADQAPASAEISVFRQIAPLALASRVKDVLDRTRQALVGGLPIRRPRQNDGPRDTPARTRARALVSGFPARLLTWVSQ